jgi:hypothetical protein
MKTRAYVSFLITGVLWALFMLGMSLAQPAAHAQNGFDCSTVTDVPAGDCEALVALYSATDGSNWTHNTNWLQTVDLCTSWHGVIANPDVVGMAPRISRQQTNEIGYYGWDVSDGCWYVTVSAEGYTPLVSPVVGVPPEVTDLHLSLAPIRNIYLPSVTR